MGYRGSGSGTAVARHFLFRRSLFFLVFMLALALGLPGQSAQAADTMAPGAILGKDQALFDANNGYMATFQTDGNFVLYDLRMKRAVWASNTVGKGGDRLVMQADGNLVIYAGTTAVWASNTAGKKGAYLKLGTDGNMALKVATSGNNIGPLGVSAVTVWETRTREDGKLFSGQSLEGGPGKQCVVGSCIKSGGYGQYYAVFQTDGNFVVYNSSWGAEWDTNTDHSEALNVTMRPDGNLVVSRGSAIRWQSNTAGNPGAFLVMQKDKNLVIYNADAKPIWSSGWNAGRHCGTWNVSCRAKKTFNSIGDWVKDAAEDAVSAASATTSAYNAVVAQATKLASAGANIAQSEWNGMVNDVKSTYASAASAVQSGYSASVNFVQSTLTAAFEALFREAAKKFTDSNKTVLTNLQNALRSLDTEGKEALNRIKRAIPGGQITQQVATDMKLLGAKLGMAANVAGSNIPNNVINSSWGIPLGGGSAGFVAGVEGEVAYVMNVQPDSSGKYTYAIVSTVGGSLGATAGQKGVVPGAGIMWQPGPIEANDGWSVGLGAEGALGTGGGLGLSWGVSKGMSGAANAIPAIEINTDGGASVDVSLKAGYTKTLFKSTF
ncbi:MAG: hypothetical protein HQL57_02835 [Magnetococcales bacterium]|nr:hypothetical protein [Magnetococcales bacterium]MBF0156104.1 hypothetical protein [Magnetococcales bacterium]